MALADTAELAAHLALSGVAAYQAEMGKVVRANTTADKSFGNISKTAYAVGGSIGKGINSAVRNIEKLGLVAGGFLVSQVKFGIDSLARLEEVTAQTNAVIRSTGGVARESAKDIRALAEKYEDLNATIDDKVIQSGENLLLTFTNIRKNAFEPALKAALDMNQAMGGGEGGLQGTIIQVGKALADPIRGLTSLRRVGVNFTLDQEKQIKTLIAHNKLFEAQKIILGELSKEFGGSFAAAGKTATGTFAKLGDAVEGAQQALATALLPALTDVAKELTGLIEGHQADITAFGKSLAGGFKDAVKWAKGLDWKGIGDGLKTAAGAAKGLIDAFMGAPDWLKQAVITGWGLNKLTGGAVTSIFGDLAKGLADNFVGRGSSPMNPLFVQDASALGGAATGAKGLVGKAVGIAQKVFIVGMVAEVADLIHGVISPGGGLEGRTTTGDLLTGDKLQWPFGPKNTPHFDLGPLKNILGGDSAFTPAPGDREKEFADRIAGDFGRIDDSAKEFQGSLAELAAVTRRTGSEIEKGWLATLDGIGARSKAKTGKDATPAQIAAIRTRDELHQLKVITEKSRASNDTKLERLRALAADAKAHGDTKTAAKVNTAIKEMKAKIAAEQTKTTTAVAAGAAGIVGAIGANMQDILLTVITNVTASDVVSTTIKKSRMGAIPGSSNNKGTTTGGIT